MYPCSCLSLPISSLRRPLRQKANTPKSRLPFRYAKPALIRFNDWTGGGSGVGSRGLCGVVLRTHIRLTHFLSVLRLPLNAFGNTRQVAVETERLVYHAGWVAKVIQVRFVGVCESDNLTRCSVYSEGHPEPVPVSRYPSLRCLTRHVSRPCD